MKTMKELFEHQLKDLYNAETQLINALPKMKSSANDSALKDAFESHLEETKRHQQKLAEICEELNVSPKGEKCNAMEGLIKEAEGLIDEAENDDVMDAGLIADAQRIEHYEIAGYGTVVRYAKELGHDKIAGQLQEILDDE
ncbi:MAG: ferritin-like domain-containing protein, partial [Pricia sp.]